MAAATGERGERVVRFSGQDDVYAALERFQARVRELNAAQKTDGEIATILNAEGLVSARGRPFSGAEIHLLRKRWGIPTVKINGKEANPQLFDERSRVSLVVPTMDKVGQLRQSGPPEPGKTYWMVFSNKGNLVRVGDRVDVVIGDFYASALPVDTPR